MVKTNSDDVVTYFGKGWFSGLERMGIVSQLSIIGDLLVWEYFDEFIFRDLSQKLGTLVVPLVLSMFMNKEFPLPFRDRYIA